VGIYQCFWNYTLWVSFGELMGDGTPIKYIKREKEKQPQRENIHICTICDHNRRNIKDFKCYCCGTCKCGCECCVN